MSFQGLLVAAMILAGLGVLNDVTITQASAVWELRVASPEMSRSQLFTSAMRIGRDHIASSIYTIVFAYLGTALTVFLVIQLYDRSVYDLLGTEEIATEIVRALSSSIGLVLAVPVTTLIAVVTVRDGRANPRAWEERLSQPRTGSLAGLEQACGQHDVDDIGNRLGAGPVALKLTGQRDPADRLSAGLDDPLEPGPVCLGRGTSDRVDDREDLVALPHGIQSRKRQADLSPQRGHDELFAVRSPRRLDGTRRPPRS